MPKVKYKSTTTGKVDKLVTFACPDCGNVEEHFEGEFPICTSCSIPDGALTTVFKKIQRMQQIFSPKNNGQRWREND